MYRPTHIYLLIPTPVATGCEIRIDFVASKLVRDYSTGDEKKHMRHPCACFQ